MTCEITITLREAVESDLEAILQIYNELVANSTAIYEVNPRTMTQQRNWFKEKKDLGFPLVVADVEGQAIGYGSFGVFRPWSCYSSTVEHSLHVAHLYRGKGIGSQILVRLMDLARQRGAHAMIAGIDSSNVGSLRLHERFGFRKVGELPQVARKFSKWLDLTFMQALINSDSFDCHQCS